MVVITRGDKGSLIANSKEKINIDSIKTYAIDTVGAGDAFSGAFLFGINNGMGLENSGKLALKIARKFSNIKIFFHKKNLGYGAALKTGLKKS